MTSLGFVVATYHEPIVEQMEATARTRAADLEATVVATVRVAGVYDVVLPAQRLAARPDVDAVVVLGTIVTGETDHDQVIGHAVASALLDVERECDTPVALGITGPGMDAAAARDRVEYGADAVAAAVGVVDALADQP